MVESSAPVLTGLRYAEATVPASLEPIATAAALVADADEPYLLYERADEVSLGFGAAVEIVLTRAEIRFRGPDDPADRWHRVPTSDDPFGQIGELLGHCGIEDWRGYGWFAFELGYLRAGLPDVPETAVLGHVIVPTREVRLSAGNTWLRALRWEDLVELHRRLDRLGEVAHWPTGELLADDRIDHDGYRRAVSAAVAEIRARRLRKVVLSRVVPVSGRIDLAATYLAGRRANTPARSFLLRLGGLAAAGFSPETVLEVGADGTVSTQPLAGTRALSGDAVTDAALREDLVNDAKEVFEHAVSVRGAQEDLRTVCVAGSVRVDEFMAVARRGSVQHLASRVSGRLAEPGAGWRALARMFPAVTVSGLPKLAAYRAIRRYESEPRELYGGVVVTADADGSLDAAVALRTIFQRGGRTWLRAGGGVVADSRPDREFEETQEKLRSIARFLVPEAPLAGGQTSA